MTMRALRYLVIMVAAAALAGCTWDTLEPPEPVPAERVLLMYDNLGDWFDADVVEAGKAVAAGALDGAERVVVYDRIGSGDEIYELVRDGSANYKKETLKKYATGENSSLDSETIARIVGDVRTLLPADHYGFAFGSHGLGWIPKSNKVPISRYSGVGAASGGEHPFAELWAERQNPLTRYFSGYGKLDVSEFVDGLNGFEWDFIILDDCFMSGVEPLYEMRTLADYIIASPTEIYMDGFPYGRVVRTVFSDWSETGFKQVGADFVDHYTNDVHKFPYGTIAVVKMAEMESLAVAVRRLNLRISELAPSVEGIQYYEGIGSPGHLFFDFDDYLNTTKAASMPAEYNIVKAQLARTVVYSGHTAKFYTDAFRYKGDVAIDHYSGLDVFIPYALTTSLFDAYRQTEWYKAVYAD